MNECNLSFIGGKPCYYEVNVNNSLSVSVIKRATKLEHHVVGAKVYLGFLSKREGTDPFHFTR